MKIAYYQIIVRSVAEVRKILMFIGTRQEARTEARKHYGEAVGVYINFLHYLPDNEYVNTPSVTELALPTRKKKKRRKKK